MAEIKVKWQIQFTHYTNSWWSKPTKDDKSKNSQEYLFLSRLKQHVNASKTKFIQHTSVKTMLNFGCLALVVGCLPQLLCPIFHLQICIHVKIIKGSVRLSWIQHLPCNQWKDQRKLTPAQLSTQYFVLCCPQSLPVHAPLLQDPEHGNLIRNQKK